jgi:integrase
LGFYLDYALSNYRDPVSDKSLAEAAREYIAQREADHKRGHLAYRQYTSFRCELRALGTLFPGKLVSELTATALTQFFGRGQVSRKSYNNRRGLIGTFLKDCLLKDWIAANPIDKVPHYRGLGHRRGSAPTLTAERCAEIMRWAEETHGGKLVPFVALCLFAGIRPDLYEGEISKLDPTSVRLDTGIIHIEPEVSKVRMKRNITIQPNLAAWLRAYPLERYPIMPVGFKRLRLKFRKQFNLSHDILRHTFISMHVGKFRSMGDAALQAGNSEAIIRKHYLDLKSTEEAEQFWGIMPRLGVVLATHPALRIVA